ncbi:MAG: heparinase II/III family protein [Bacteroidales bacterium]|nr:heparinase II/III family protein [Bacteroidales bacterium]
MKKTLLSILAVFLLTSGTMSAYVERNILRNQADEAKLKTLLIPDQKWVPFPAYSDRAGWDALLGDWKDDLIARGEDALNYEWRVVTATDYLTHDRGGSQGEAGANLNSNVMKIVDLFFAELATGQGKYINKMANGAFTLCETSTWVLSHHLYLQKTAHHFPQLFDNCIDLVCGDVGSVMAWVYYYFHNEFDKIEPEISRRLYEELDKRIMTPYLTETHFWWKGDRFHPDKGRTFDKSIKVMLGTGKEFDPENGYLNNWTPWCSVNCLQVFALCEKDMDRYAKAAYMSMESVDKYINNLEGDGCCDEGPSYWYQGPAKNFEYLLFLNWVTGGKVNALDNPMIKRMGEYISSSVIGNGWVVNFSDASARGGGNPLVLYNYGKGVNSPLMKHYAAYVMDGKPVAIPRDRYIIRMFYSLLVKDDLKKETPELVTEPYTWYPETQMCYMREKDGFFVASKGGHNAQSHNHNDIGSVSVYYKSIPFLIDAGVGTYITKTFSPQRYEIWTMQSNYHNLPLINGVAEMDGRQYESKQSTFDPKTMTFSVDFAGTYPAEACVKSMLRNVTLKGGKVTIKDSYLLSQSKKPTDFNWLTWGDVDIKTPGKLKITVQGETVTLNYDGKRLEPIIETIVQDDPPLQRVWGDQIYRVTLRERKAATKGTYTFTVTR